MSQQGFFLFVRYLTEIKKNDWQFTVVCFEKRELNTDAITMFYQQRNDFSRELGIFLEALQLGILTTFDTPDWLFLLDPTERQQTEKNQ